MKLISEVIRDAAAFEQRAYKAEIELAQLRRENEQLKLMNNALLAEVSNLKQELLFFKENNFWISIAYV